MPSSDVKLYETDCANTETLFRIIQSIPSPKVEPLKRWLARVGKERIDEIEIPEDYGDDVDIAPGPDGILALAVASLADIPASDRGLLTRKLEELER